MEIGIIIFVIWVIFSVVSGIIEGASKNKKKNKQPQTRQRSNPVNRQAEEKKKSAEQELQDLVNKYESYKQKAETSSTERMSGHYKNLADQLANHLKQYNIDVEKPVVQTHKVEQQPEQISSEHENAYINQRKEQIHKNRPKKQQEAIKQLLAYSQEEKKSLMNVQRESIDDVEKEAEQIINNTELSERTRRAMVKQLYLNSKHKFNDEAINVDENQVVNGIIWSEILKRPNELK
ncbi:hypothetical protein MXE81_05300 [Mammaliicoccus sciuri]|uniref:Uncharacterized protein n=1 Tax=Mammaliicoccus sciuri TaxID=1296 RepID=A0AAI8GTP1_MAMSC|nr:hypothetical protein [Mammaliicoccus sciuri]OOV37852.1 hypothetical protein BS756_13180 [Staphylococcus sp. MB371]PCQ21871.1 hypothetical protein CP995_01220 [Klebsiella pneumoniae]ASE34026.1 hypothetical protein CEP64_05390 [Mammaliicoccus sciuri]KTT86247.1 hypothetical protein NS1R_03365 [Mammaliicoccus sciuri]KTT88133.1 hypothetical protein NS112_09990 [Mammaliicoccus sciuri]